LVLDKYEDVIVFQISTAGLEKLRDEVVAAAVEVFAPRAVVERSDIPVRREEGLSEASGVRYGEDPGLVEFSENGLRFFADVLQGQKTGFFLDQKDLRKTIASLAKDRTILNLFSYSGAASVAALKSGAKSARNVDSSDAAIALIAKQTELNGIDASAVTSEPLDIFQFFNQKSDATYDMVIMDPPALIKSQRDAEEGKKAYHFLNRAALRMVADKGIFVTSSCSRYLTEDDFAFMLRRAAQQAGVTLSVLRMERQSADHPTSVYFPESAYLKSYVCEVRRHAPDGAGHRQAA
jgi:23S rRNA (cytosine1962-C5)-methyltransferase